MSVGALELPIQLDHVMTLLEAVTLSIGVAVIDLDKQDIKEALNEAKRCMNQKEKEAIKLLFNKD